MYVGQVQLNYTLNMYIVDDRYLEEASFVAPIM